MAEHERRNDGSWAARSLARWRLIAALSGFLMVLILAWAPTKELLQPWRNTQAEYNRLASSFGVATVPIQIQQIWIPQSGRVDRCGSCHLGMAGFAGLDSHPPFQSHPSTPHSPETHGCTYCHAGQGWATMAEDAHGEGGSWPHPILPLARTEAGCGVCHSGISVPLPEALEDIGETVALYGCEMCHAEGRREAPSLTGAALRGIPADWPERHRGLSPPDEGIHPVAQADGDELRALAAWLETRVGAPALARGKMVFQQLGCQGCHRRGGVGGDVGPDLTAVGERDVREIDGEAADSSTLPRWLQKHLVAPQELYADSRMPPVDLEELERETDLDDLVTYLLSLRGEPLPASLTPPDRARVEYRLGRDFPTSGRGLYVTFCAACHGIFATGAELETYGLVTPMVGARGFLATTTPRYLRDSILRGRRARTMPAWGPGDGGLTTQEIDAIVEYLRSRASQPRALEELSGDSDRGRGKAVFEERCLPCHGPVGAGPRLGADLLAAGALEGFDRRTLYQAIQVGWVEEGMPSFAFLRTSEAADLLAYLAPSLSGSPPPGPGHDGRHSYFGLQIWRAKCLECHGAEGEGGSAALLNTRPYLDWAHDDYLAARIRGHRSARARSAVGGVSDDDLEALLDHMRSWSGRALPAPSAAPEAASIARGRGLFASRCVECHGEGGSGTSGPALADRDFLDLVSRPFLVMSILEGRKGTAMRSWKDHGEQPVGLQDAFDIADYIRSLGSLGDATSTTVPGQRPAANQGG